MKSDIDWSRYTVVHWFAAPLSDQAVVTHGGRTRAFAGLAEAVLFVARFDYDQRTTVRIDCGGKTYQLPDILWLAGRPDFPYPHELSVG